MENLDTLVKQYGDTKSSLDIIKKECDTENAKIKLLMAKNGLDSYVSGGYEVSYCVQQKESMNEEMLLQVLSDAKNKDFNPKKLGIIKTKEYVDTDALEDAIYKGIVSEEVLLSLDTCRVIKDVETLRVKKVKEA